MSRSRLIRLAVKKVMSETNVQTVSGITFFRPETSPGSPFTRPAREEEMERAAAVFLEGVYIPGLGLTPFREVQNGNLL